MNRFPRSFVAISCILTAGLVMAAGRARIDYPQSRKDTVVDDHHGVKVADPYRWLEDADSPETRAWVEAQNKLTASFLAAIPERQQIKTRLTKVWDYEKFGLPQKQGGKYFYSHNTGLQNQSVLYIADSPDAQGRILLDPNTMSPDGTVALSGTAVSEDGRYLAYGVAHAGSDWQEWRIKDIATGKDLDDHLQWVKRAGTAWTHDGKGFFYGRYPEPRAGEALRAANYYHKLYYHRLGTPQSQDVLVYERPDQKEWGFGGRVTEDGRYLVIHVSHGTRPQNRVFYKDLKDPAHPVTGDESKVLELLTTADASYSFVGNDGPVFWFATDKDAPRERVIAVDTRQPEPAHWQEIIPQAAETLESVDIVGDRFLARYLKDARTQVKVYSLDGKFERDVELPGMGSASGFRGKRKDTETFYSFTSYTSPPTVYRYDVTSGASTEFRRPRVDFDGSRYETKQVFYTSKDGTRVPMFIVHRKNLALDGNNPTYLYGYGGFRVSMTPYFTPAQAIWLEMGGVYAMPNLRGGGEYGQAWHDAGKLLNKQNVFDDFLAAAQWLIDNKYTSPPKLAIAGGSNGGLLVGAAMTQRPELFGAALPAVGVMDMLRFHKFTVGWGWISDYGTPEKPDEFKALHAYSPYHRLKEGTRYPATLVTTSDHDDRVVPAHSYKFAAALQAAPASDGPPCLIRIETRAGHGAGKPTTKSIEETADKWAFLVRALDMKLPDSFGQ
jgi:prolyl oligopeptidase